MDIEQIWLENGRRAIEKVGGAKKMADLLGMATSSYLSQCFGPRGGTKVDRNSRAPSAKMMRKMEQALGLPTGSLDHEDGQTLQTPVAPMDTGSTTAAPAPEVSFSQKTPAADTIDADQLTRTLNAIYKAVSDENVQLSSERFATLVTMGYEDASEHGGKVREAHLRRMVQLLK